MTMVFVEQPLAFPGSAKYRANWGDYIRVLDGYNGVNAVVASPYAM